jgi:hypothetical protein
MLGEEERGKQIMKRWGSARNKAGPEHPTPTLLGDYISNHARGRLLH